MDLLKIASFLEHDIYLKIQDAESIASFLLYPHASTVFSKAMTVSLPVGPECNDNC